MAKNGDLPACQLTAFNESADLPDDWLGGAEHELQHSDSRGELSCTDVPHVADGAGCFHHDHVVLVAQAALQELVEAARLPGLAGP